MPHSTRVHASLSALDSSHPPLATSSSSINAPPEDLALEDCLGSFVSDLVQQHVEQAAASFFTTGFPPPPCHSPTWNVAARLWHGAGESAPSIVPTSQSFEPPALVSMSTNGSQHQDRYYLDSDDLHSRAGSPQGVRTSGWYAPINSRDLEASENGSAAGTPRLYDRVHPYTPISSLSRQHYPSPSSHRSLGAIQPYSIQPGRPNTPMSPPHAIRRSATAPEPRPPLRPTAHISAQRRTTSCPLRNSNCNTCSANAVAAATGANSAATVTAASAPVQFTICRICRDPLAGADRVQACCRNCRKASPLACQLQLLRAMFPRATKPVVKAGKGLPADFGDYELQWAVCCVYMWKTKKVMPCGCAPCKAGRPRDCTPLWMRLKPAEEFV